jgi:hypothetical protein
LLPVKGYDFKIIEVQLFGVRQPQTVVSVLLPALGVIKRPFMAHLGSRNLESKLAINFPKAGI